MGREVRRVPLDFDELVGAMRQDILAIGSIYRTVGDALFDEATTRLAERVAATAKEHCAEKVADLLEACQAALAHVEELREAWRTGALSEQDGQGGTRSNRNVEVEGRLRAAIAKEEGKEE